MMIWFVLFMFYIYLYYNVIFLLPLIYTVLGLLSGRPGSGDVMTSRSTKTLDPFARSRTTARFITYGGGQRLVEACDVISVPCFRSNEGGRRAGRG